MAGTRIVPEFTGGPALTARQLAGHLAGVRHYVAKDFTRSARAYRDVIDALSIFAAHTLFTVPGTRYFYSSYGYNLLGAAVARAANEDFRQHVASSVLRPLGLRRTMFERADSNVAGLSHGFDPRKPVSAWGGAWPETLRVAPYIITVARCREAERW